MDSIAKIPTSEKLDDQFSANEFIKLIKFDDIANLLRKCDIKL